MNFVRHAENRPGQDPQIFSSRSNHYFSNAGGCLGKIQCRRAGGKNLNGSNRRTVFSMANETTTNYLPPHPKPDNNQKPLTRCPFFRSKPIANLASFARNHPENIYSPKNANIFKHPLFSAKVKHHKSPANRGKIGGRVHFHFSK